MADENEIEHRVGVAELAVQIKALVASHGEIKAMLREMATAAAEAERRATESCKTCAMWGRVNNLEKDMAGINGKLAGVGIAAGALSFLASWFIKDAAK